MEGVFKKVDGALSLTCVFGLNRLLYEYSPVNNSQNYAC